jgi:CHU_C Type IX secretion signal domain
MPSYSDDKGNVVLLNAQGKVVDELAYNEKWHHPLIDNREGVSLERIDYGAAAQNPENWHSAATSVGYGTPTYKNSHYRTDAQLKGTITISPEICSPNNDGRDDFVTISYQFSEPGYVANITVFDAAGRPVRYLQRNALCGIQGNFRWDGLGEKNQALPSGIYIVYTEIFNLKGKTRRFKNTVVLVRGR